jgi:hypothetical protein
MTMKLNIRRCLSLAAALTVLSVAAGAWPAPPDGKAAATTPSVDPAALAALDRMGAYLRTLKVFQVEAATSREDVLDNGLKVQFDVNVSLFAQRPDHLRVDVSSDRQERQYFYDGKQFTLLARRVNFYATVPAPSTIGELVDAVEEKYGIEFPLADLFRWGATTAGSAGIIEAVDLGPSMIEGIACRHFALRQEGFDWQIWIQSGDFPLPRKLVITTTTDEARPQYQAAYTWNLAPSLSEADFAFVPTEDARRIIFNEISPENGGNKKEK